MMREARYVHKLIRPSKDHVCGFCGGPVPKRSFCIKTEQKEQHMTWGYMVTCFQRWAHLTCFEADQLKASPVDDFSPALAMNK